MPLVTVVIPTLNERDFIEQCLDSLQSQDIGAENMEILVVDGGSNDGTRQLIKEYQQSHGNVRLLNNEKKFTMYAFNIGILNANANSEYITFLNCHAVYSADRFSKTIQYIKQYGVDAVGGRSNAVSRLDSLFGRSVSLVLQSKFGTGSRFRTKSGAPQLTDTASGCLYRKSIFDEIGLFNENLVRTQDLDLNIRLRKVGGKILLAPDIVTNYYVRSDLKSFCRYNFVNSFWVTYPKKYLNYFPVSLRHFVPMFFVLSLIVFGIMSLFSSICFYIFIVITGSYFATNLFFSIKLVLQKRDIRYLFIVPVLFTILHISYGLGSLWGFIMSLF